MAETQTPDPDDLMAWIETKPRVERPAFGETEQGRREKKARPGFAGTLQGYLDWLDEMLMYGGLTLAEPRPHE